MGGLATVLKVKVSSQCTTSSSFQSVNRHCHMEVLFRGQDLCACRDKLRREAYLIKLLAQSGLWSRTELSAELCQRSCSWHSNEQTRNQSQMCRS